jgi:phosphorylcholine metabolism protein LicD
MCGIKYGYITKPSTLGRKWSYFVLQCLSLGFSRERMLEMRESMIQKYNRENTEFYLNSSLYCYPSKIFDQFSELEFEGIKFPVPAGYTTYLECAYGDYMSLPPENKRTRHTPYPPDFGNMLTSIPWMMY